MGVHLLTTTWYVFHGSHLSRKLPNHNVCDNLEIAIFELIMLTDQYHGGTNFGRSAGGPFITTSYDYDAPLDEYGNIFLFVWTF